MVRTSTIGATGFNLWIRPVEIHRINDEMRWAGSEVGVVGSFLNFSWNTSVWTGAEQDDVLKVRACRMGTWSRARAPKSFRTIWVKQLSFTIGILKFWECRGSRIANKKKLKENGSAFPPYLILHTPLLENWPKTIKNLRQNFRFRINQLQKKNLN